MSHSAALRRRLALRGAALLVALAVMTTGAAAQELPQLQRIRSESPRIHEAIAEGVRWSPSFRRLVDIVYASDGIVYVEEGNCRHAVAACLLMAITTAGPFRVLHVRVNLRKTTGCRLTATIGHELHHVSEVLDNPEIRSGLKAYAFFARVGPTLSGRFETQAAIDSGLRIDREACGQHHHDRLVPGDMVAQGVPADSVR